MRSIFSITIVGFGIFSTIAAAQAIETHGDWNLLCPPAVEEQGVVPQCHLSQSIQSTDNDITLLLATIVSREDTETLILTAPLGIDLGAGLTWRVDQRRRRRFIFNTCTPEGCFAAITLAPDLRSELQRGATLSVQYNDGAANPVSADISLIGFTAGSAALEAQ